MLLSPSRLHAARSAHAHSLVRVRRASRLAIAVALCALSGGCFWRRSDVKTRAIVVAAAEAANDNSPVTVELLMVHDEKLLETLMGIPAAKWFAERDQIRNDFPLKLETASWELVPGQRVNLGELPFRKRGKALLVFASYPTPGDHRARLGPLESVRIDLREKDFAVVRLD